MQGFSDEPRSLIDQRAGVHCENSLPAAFVAEENCFSDISEKTSSQRRGSSSVKEE